MMKTGRITGMAGMPHSQRGVVLFIALIILVAMTLAGIGMMRSVDTGSVIAGNLAFKQATLLASDRGIGDAFNNALMSVVNTASIPPNGFPVNKQILFFDSGQSCTNVPGATAAGCPNGNPASPDGNIYLPGYFSAPVNPCEVTGQTTGTVIGTDCTTWQVNAVTPNNQPWWINPNNWPDCSQNPLPANCSIVSDPTNNARIATVSYLIHRMCQLQNEMQTNAPLSFPATLGHPTGDQLCQTEPDNVNGSLGRYFTIFRITVRSVGPRNTVTYTQALAKIMIL